MGPWTTPTNPMLTPSRCLWDRFRGPGQKNSFESCLSLMGPSMRLMFFETAARIHLRVKVSAYRQLPLWEYSRYRYRLPLTACCLQVKMAVYVLAEEETDYYYFFYKESKRKMEPAFLTANDNDMQTHKRNSAPPSSKWDLTGADFTRFTSYAAANHNCTLSKFLKYRFYFAKNCSGNTTTVASDLEFPKK